MPVEVIESYAANYREEDKDLYELELQLKIAFLRFVCGKEPAGCSLDIIRENEKGIPMASIVLAWKGKEYALDEASSAYIVLCKKALSLFDNNLCGEIWAIAEKIIENKQRLALKYIHLGSAHLIRTYRKKEVNSKDNLIELIREMILEQQRKEGEQLIGSRELDQWANDKFSYLFPSDFRVLDQAEFLVSCGDWEHTINWLNKLDEVDWEDLNLWTLLESLDPS